MSDALCLSDPYKSLLVREVAGISYAASYSSVGNYTKSYETWKRSRNIVASFREKIDRHQGELKVLDLGCAHGLYLHVLEAMVDKDRQASFHGVDLCSSSICLAEEIKKILKRDRLFFQTGDCRQLPFPDENFDVILCAEVIEHIEDPRLILQEIKRVLKPDGMVIVTTPNGTNAFRRLRGFFGLLGAREQKDRLDEEAVIKPIVGCGHVSVKGVGAWRKLIRSQGLWVERIRRGSLFFGGAPYDRHPCLFAWSLLIDRAADYLPFLLGWSENLTFQLRKQE